MLFVGREISFFLISILCHALALFKEPYSKLRLDTIILCHNIPYIVTAILKFHFLCLVGSLHQL